MKFFREFWKWASEHVIKFWWRSGSRIWIHIAVLVRCAWTEVCTVPVLLVSLSYYIGEGHPARKKLHSTNPRGFLQWNR